MIPMQERNTFPDIPREISVYDAASLSGFRSGIAGKKTVIDMGCGHGDFLLEHTVQNPDTTYIGIEISRKRTAKTSSRLQKRDIRNYRVIHSDGELALQCFFPGNSVDELNVNFPDPWLRKRQWKNRILRPSFLIQVLRVLKPGGLLNFVTDVEEYALHTAGILERFPGLKNCYGNTIEKNLFGSFPTLFYRKMSPVRDIHYISFAKLPGF